MDLYQVSSNYVPRVKTGPTPWDNKFEHRNKEGKLQKSSPLKLEGVELDIWNIACPNEPLPRFFKLCP